MCAAPCLGALDGVRVQEHAVRAADARAASAARAAREAAAVEAAKGPYERMWDERRETVRKGSPPGVRFGSELTQWTWEVRARSS